MNDQAPSAMEVNGDSRKVEGSAASAPTARTDARPRTAASVATRILSSADQQQLDLLLAGMPGAADNVQNVYPLSPLQEGLLFHHLLNERADTYVLSALFELQSEARLRQLIEALQQVMERHEVLRSSILWEGLSLPLQVVHRQVTLCMEELSVPPGSTGHEQLKLCMRPGHRAWDLRAAPLLRLQTTADADSGRRYALLQVHHLLCDYQSWSALIAEALAYCEGRGDQLADPADYRDYVALSAETATGHDAEAFFRAKLASVDEGTVPFGLADVRSDGSQLDEASMYLDLRLSRSIREIAKRYGVSAARLFHAAWAAVVARTSGRDDVVFGTVLLAEQRRAASVRPLLGMFVNTLPLRLKLSGSVEQLIRQTDQELRELLRYQQAPLTLAQRCSGIVGAAPLFTALLNYRHSPARTGGDASGSPAIRVLARGEAWSNYPITVIVDDRGDDFVLTAQTDRRVGPDKIAAYLGTAVRSLVEALAREPQTPAASLQILPDSEYRQAVQSDPSAPYSGDDLIHEVFEQQVERAPNARAVTCEGRSLTYAELNARANQLARHLMGAGVRPDSLVGLCVERSLDMVVGLLGILKAGGAYLPLDPDYPAERLAYMLSDARPTVVLSQESLRSRLPACNSKVIALDRDWEEIAQRPADNVRARAHGLCAASLAYVIYTSGSTGEPKGVMVEHRNVTRLFSATDKWFGFSEHDTWTLFHSVAFDFSVWELWGALMYGGRLIVVPYLTARSPADFYRLLCQEGVTVLNQTPSAFNQLIEAQAHVPRQHALRVVIFGGEALELRALRPWVERNGAQRPALINMYGITETTVHVTYRPITQEEIATESASPIGVPIPDLRIYLLDRYRQPVPIGVVAEMHVGGAGVARGYLNRPELTAERFLRDLFVSDPQARLYKTGDLGRRRSDGSIEYLGRNDHQVKIRGYRIELGEIEAQLARHAPVKEVRVIAREDVPGQKRLVAYVVESGTGAFDLEAARSYLKERLPEFMVPHAFVTLERFPLTSNGKLDRSALPVPDEHAVALRRYVAPRNDLERTLCEIWAEVLGLARVGVDDNFFAIGGDSILCLRMLARANAAGLVFSVTDLFRHQSVAQLAGAIQLQAAVGHLSPKSAAFALLSPAERTQFAASTQLEDAYPLSRLQEGMYFHSEIARDSAVYHDVFSYCVEAEFRRDLFEQATRGLVERHPMLRTGFVMSCDQRLVQVVYEEAAAQLQVEDISLLSPAEQDEHVRSWIGQEKHHRFSWSEPPLLRIFIHVRAPGRFQYSLSFHHAIVDGWSVASLQTELMSDYASLLAGRGHIGAPPKALYRDYIARELAALRSEESKEYWLTLLEGVGPSSLPSLHPVSAADKGRDVATCSLQIDASISRELERRAGEINVQLKLLLLAAHAKVMGVIHGEQSVLTGLVTNGRLEEQDGEQVIGLHLNSLPVRIELAPGSWRDLIVRLRDLEESMLPHRRYPLAAIQESLGTGQLFDTLFNFIRFHVYRRLDDAIKISQTAMFEQTNFSLLVNFAQEPHGSAISLSLSFDPAVLERSQVERIAGYYERTLRRMSRDVDEPHHATTLLDEVEQRQLLVQLNGAETLCPGVRLVHELFEEQVERTPEAVAVTYMDRSVSYGELNRCANRLARHLRARGIRAGHLVGICIERSVEMVVGLLAVLKAGSAYLPLDPNYPPERLRYMLEDAKPRLVLTEHKLTRLLGACATIALDRDAPDLDSQDENDASADQVGVGPEDLVYVIYTSGSTGRPKGTAMPHGPLVNLMQWHRRDLPCDGTGRVLQFAALSFDVAFQEVFSTLCSGATLVLLDEWLRRDARALMEFLSSQRITRLFLPPLMLQSLAEVAQTADAAVPASLREVITAGEQLRVSPDVASFFERLPGCRLHNHYGPTETHVVTALTLSGDPKQWPVLPTIGRPLPNTRIYILDAHRQPVPLGVAGEIYIAGACVAQGYLRRPELTEERFLSDPFAGEPGARMYKTGDLGRWRPDQTIEYMGRNDHQVKVRGYRVELGEVEARLASHELVKDAAVVVREDVPNEKRIVAYLTQRIDGPLDPADLYAHLKAALPDYMIPSAFVALPSLPVTPNGKLNRRALPVPDVEAFPTRPYEAPLDERERTLADIWQSLLGLDRVGREDNFFRLGGHSLLIVQMAERLRREGFLADVRRMFESPTLADLAASLTTTAERAPVPANLIPTECRKITPDMLPLLQLTPEHIEKIVCTVPGGVANVADIYPLAPAQEGILFHHLLDDREGDTYVLLAALLVPSRALLDELIAALGTVIERHEALRTAVLWEELPQPVQVVYRETALPVEQVALAPGPDWHERVAEWVRSERHSLDLRRAPLLRLKVAAADGASGGWVALLQVHHIVADGQSLTTIISEVRAHLEGRTAQLPPARPYREHVAQSLAYAKLHDPLAFFQGKLDGIDESTAPFGLMDVYGSAARITEASVRVGGNLAGRIHSLARHLGVSAATLFHAAWGLVVGRTSYGDDVVFGTVLLGRLQGSAGGEGALGMFVNTLPLRLRLGGLTAKELIKHTHQELVALLGHEQASLSVAQRCSGISGSAPLFTSLLNYRYGTQIADSQSTSSESIRLLATRGFTNYPLVLSVDDLTDDFLLTAQTDQRISAQRILGYVSAVLLSLSAALERAPQTPALALQVVPHDELQQIVEVFNATQTEYPKGSLVCEIFEELARRLPDSVAVVYDRELISYGELNRRCNQLAGYLREQGVVPGDFVPVLMPRSLPMLLAQIAVLKCAAVYVPLDPDWPAERQAFILRDCGARVVIAAGPEMTPGLDTDACWISYAAASSGAERHSSENLRLKVLAPPPAYLMYTSGSSGTPKGVVVPHHSVVRLVVNNHYIDLQSTDCLAHHSNPSFDASTFEVWGALLNGAKLVIVPQSAVLDAQSFRDLLDRDRVTVLWMSVGLFNQQAGKLSDALTRLRYLIVGGDVVDPEVVRRVLRDYPPQHLLNGYGPTEGTTFSTTFDIESLDEAAGSVPIGRPISNTRIYVLSRQGQVVPVGAVGEICIGGDGVAHGYLGQPELTAMRFIRDPFSADRQARLYKTGDLGRWRSDGVVEFLGRTDNQVKVRGYRIELGEIEGQLLRSGRVAEAVVLARQDAPGDKRLVAYVVPADVRDGPSVEELRAALKDALPDYMIPTAFVTLDSLPLNSSGKVNRSALPVPGLAAHVSQQYERPQGEVEEALADIWRELLLVERVGREDHFFELGGDSLKAIKLIVRVTEKLDIPMRVQAIFQHPTVRELGEYLARLQSQRETPALWGEAGAVEEFVI